MTEDKYCMVPLIRGPESGQRQTDRQQIGVARGRAGRACCLRSRVPVLADEMHSVDVSEQWYECTQHY